MNDSSKLYVYVMFAAPYGRALMERNTMRVWGWEEISTRYLKEPHRQSKDVQTVMSIYPGCDSAKSSPI